MRRIAVLMLAAGTLAARLSAQSAPVAAAHHAKACFQGARGDLCTWFPLFEAGAAVPLFGGPGHAPVLVNYAAGFMVNHGNRSAWGVTAFASLEDEIRGGVAVRVRRWLGPRTSLDLAAGVHLFGSAQDARTVCSEFDATLCGTETWTSQVDRGSPTIQARLGWHELVALTARVDILRTSGWRMDCSSGSCTSAPVGHTAPRLYLGAELGSQAGISAQALSAVAAAIAMVVVAVAWDGPFGSN